METPSYSKETVSGQAINITAANLNIVSRGQYHISVDYVSSGGETLNLAENTLKVYTEDDFSIWYDNWIIHKNDNIVSHFSYPAVGTLMISVNGTPVCTKDLKKLYEVVYVFV
jgi:hypothetical protein